VITAGVNTWTIVALGAVLAVGVLGVLAWVWSERGPHEVPDTAEPTVGIHVGRVYRVVGGRPVLYRRRRGRRRAPSLLRAAALMLVLSPLVPAAARFVSALFRG